MYSEIVIGTFKRKYNCGEWSREKIETMATNMFNKHLLSQSDLDNLQNFFKPTIEEIPFS